MRVYKNVPAFPGLYQWDYEITNVSVASNHGGRWTNGLQNFTLNLNAAMPDLANLYFSGPPGWVADLWVGPGDTTTLWAQAPQVDVYDDPASNTCWCQSPAIGPGETVHLGFTTPPRHVANLAACVSDEWGMVYDTSCGIAWRANEECFMRVGRKRSANRSS